MVTRVEWATDLLRLANWPRTKSNLVALVAWLAAEGTEAKWNPLATTKPWPGATNFNSVGVKNYADLASGLSATLDTLRDSGHGYGGIRRRLRIGAWPRSTLRAVERSDWGTGGLAVQIVDDVRSAWDFYSQQPIGQ